VSDYFAGKVALVTGAASGLGLELARQLHARGCRVVSVDVQAVPAFEGDTTSVVLDVTDRAAFEAVIESHGPLDFLFNNAGIAISGEVDQVEPEQCRRLLEINLMATIHGSSAAYKVMKQRGRGHIVNVASVAGIAGCPYASSYAASKAGVLAFTASLRAEARAYGVRVSAVCPGMFRSNIAEYPARLPILSAAEAARRTLRGVERNQAVIFFPTSAWLSSLLWWAAVRSAAPFHGLMLWLVRRKRNKQLTKPGPE
jgi:NAD(P)-dependent dehydrogenase (short-subunit alcohol dehydrogenase family)